MRIPPELTTTLGAHLRHFSGNIMNARQTGLSIVLFETMKDTLRRSLCAFAAMHLMLTAAWGDVLMLPSIIGESSPSGRYVVRVVPADVPSRPESECKAHVYEIDAEGKVYNRVATFRLKCKVAPMMVAVVDSPPRLVAFDEWLGSAVLESVAIYDLLSGTPILYQKIKDLLPESLFKALPRTEGGAIWIVNKPLQSEHTLVTSNAGVSPLLRGKSDDELQVIIDVKEAKLTFSSKAPEKR